MSAPVWNLESIFAGGPRGETFRTALASTRERATALVETCDGLPPLSADSLDVWSAALEALFALAGEVRRINTYASCLDAAHATDAAAGRLKRATAACHQLMLRAWVPVEDGLGTCEASVFEALLGRPELEAMGPRLRDLRRQQPLRLPLAEASLDKELARDGLHAWGMLYQDLSGRVQCPVGPDRVVSASQALNLMSSPDRAERAAGLRGLQQGWAEHQDLCATVLTHIVGTRQTLNDRRGVDELADSLARHRMERASLDALLAAAARARPLLLRYLELKARALGVERLGWHDLTAPLGEVSPWSWDRAADFVRSHFDGHHPDLGGLARRAIGERWIEAEDRAGKRPGAWCASLPEGGESRVFMTFGGTFRSTVTLAHELGHAYHNWALRDAHPAERHVPATLAETASVFAESLVRDAALEAARTPDEELAMRDARLAAGATFLMNLPFRFDLERELYVMRREGALDPEVLSARTEALQRRHFGDALDGWFPLFWAEKLHFYVTHFAFYNYPYTFGYLFASLVYQRFKAEGHAGHQRYVELLQRTGTDRAEDLAADVLGVDLTDPDAWFEGARPLEEDLARFEALVS